MACAIEKTAHPEMFYSSHTAASANNWSATDWYVMQNIFPLCVHCSTTTLTMMKHF